MKYQITIWCYLLILFAGNPQSLSWQSPQSANSIQNPVNPTKEVLSTGKKLYVQYCVLCHGTTGKGDGVAGVALNPKPAKFTTPQFKQQTDGAIYWKITTGNPPMAAYKDILNDEEIWKIIHYLKTL